MFLSIIIRAYNEEKNIGKLLRIINDQKHDYEVIVVNSGSTDKTAEIAKQYGAKIGKIKPEEFSFGYSLNKRIENARGDICVFISAHCFPTSLFWLKEIVNPLVENSRIGLVYGKQRGAKESKFSEKEIFKKWYPDDKKGIQHHPFSNNANAAIRKKLWGEIKYDETLTGLEDLDWAKKILKKGMLIYYNPDAEVIHLHNESWNQIYNRYKREAIAFYKIFPEEKFGFFSFIKLFILHSIKERKINFKEIVFYKYYQFKGTFDGARYKKELSGELKRIFYYPNNKK